MFGLFKRDPIKKLENEYKRLMENARDIQRSGDLRLYAEKIAEANALEEKIATLKAKQQS